jgi:hypothetical protein
MGAILVEDDENCRDTEESLEVAVLEAVAATDVVRAMKDNFCMRRRDGEDVKNESMGS